MLSHRVGSIPAAPFIFTSKSFSSTCSRILNPTGPRVCAPPSNPNHRRLIQKQAPRRPHRGTPHVAPLPGHPHRGNPRRFAPPPLNLGCDQRGGAPHRCSASGSIIVMTGQACSEHRAETEHLRGLVKPSRTHTDLAKRPVVAISPLVALDIPRASSYHVTWNMACFSRTREQSAMIVDKIRRFNLAGLPRRGGCRHFAKNESRCSIVLTSLVSLPR